VGPGGQPISGEASQGDCNWDPDNCFKGIPLRTGLIERRMMQKQIETDKDFAKAMKGAQDEVQKEAIFRREMRKWVRLGGKRSVSTRPERARPTMKGVNVCTEAQAQT